MPILDEFTDRDLARFHSKVDKAAGNGPTKDCWLWKDATAKVGYGYLGVGGRTGRRIQAHRIAYEIAKGPIPDGLQIDHLCSIRNCVNPAHLEAVTQRENLLRGDTLTRRNAMATHCKHGHLFDAKNTRKIRTGGRACRQCSIDSRRKSNQKKLGGGK